MLYCRINLEDGKREFKDVLKLSLTINDSVAVVTILDDDR